MYEDWKVLPGFYGQFRVSPFGEVYDTYADRMIKPFTDKAGYICVQIKYDINGITYAKKRVHRLVAECYLKGYEPGMPIKFVDGNKNHISTSNLELVNTRRNKPILYVETDTVYSSAFEAARKLRCDRANIVACCKGRLKSYKGRHFQYANLKDEDIAVPKRIRDKDTGDIYESQRDAAKAIGGTQSGVAHVLRGDLYSHKGHRFEYVDE